jgi:hypothetical protein
MIFLFTIAIFINLVGLKVEAYGAKKCLLFGMSGLLVINTVVGVFLNLDLTDKWLYIVVFGLGVGIFGGFAWPSCLYVPIKLIRCYLSILIKKMGFLFRLGTVPLNWEISSHLSHIL